MMNKLHFKLSALAVLASSASALVGVSAHAGTSTDRHGNVGYDTAQECDAAVNGASAKFYESYTHKKPLRHAGETRVQAMSLSSVDGRYARGACDVGASHRHGRDGVARELVGKYVPYSPNMSVNAYYDRHGQLVRLSMQQCDNAFAENMPRPVAAPPAPVAAAPRPVVAAPPPAPAPAPAPVVMPPPPPPAPLAVAPVVAPVAAVMPMMRSSLVPYVFGGIGGFHDGVNRLGGDDYTWNYNKTRFGGQIGAGLRFTDLLGAELAYQGSNEFRNTYYDDIKVTALAARMTLGAEVAPGMRLFGKLGAASVHHNEGFTSGSQTRATAGLGMLFNVANNLDVRLDYDHYFKKGNNVPNYRGADYFGVGLQYNFK